VHFLRNALDHLPRKADDDCLQELRWLYGAAAGRGRLRTVLKPTDIALIFAEYTS
jgi:transposase-like protein